MVINHGQINYIVLKHTNYNKLTLGLGTYGRAFRLANANNFALGIYIHDQNNSPVICNITVIFLKIGAPTSNLPTAGTWTCEAGFLSYYEVCQRLSQGWTRQWSNEQAVPFASQGQEWVILMKFKNG